MTKDEVIESVCSIVALAYRSIGDYSLASDGFCQSCFDTLGRSWGFQHAGVTLDYVRLAVVEKLKRDGHKIYEGFDIQTGEEL